METTKLEWLKYNLQKWGLQKNTHLEKCRHKTNPTIENLYVDVLGAKLKR